MLAHRPLLIAAIPILLVGISSAQVPSGNPSVNPCLPYEPSNVIDWPSDPAYGSASSFGRVLVGRFSSPSATDRDGVIVAGGVAVHSRVLASYTLLDPITFPTAPPLVDVADIAVLSGQGPGGTDALLATDSRGLLWTTYQGSGFGDPVLLEGIAWVDAGQIEVVDADGQGGLDLVAVASDRMAVVTLLDAGGSNVSGIVFLPRTVLDVTVCEWDGNAGCELVVLTTGGLVVHTLGGTPVATVPHAGASGAIARVGSPSGDLVAWGRPKPGGGGELVVLDGGGVDSVLDLAIESCQPIEFVPKSILAGDYNQDYHEDLLLAHEADRTVVVLVSTGQVPHFTRDDSWHDVLPLDVTITNPGAVGIPAFEQVDGVGPDDVVVPVGSSGTVQVLLNMSRYRYLGGAQSPPTSKQVIDNQSSYRVNHPHQWRLTLEVPQPYRGYRWARVVLFEEPSAGALIASAPVTTDFELVRVAGFVDVPTQYIDVQHEFPPGEVHWPELRPYYYAEVRFVDDDETTLSPRYYAGMTLRQSDPTEPDPATPTYSHLLPGGLPPLLDLLADYDLPAGSSTHIGAYIPMSSSPAFVDGERPEELLSTTGWAVVYEDDGN